MKIISWLWMVTLGLLGFTSCSPSSSAATEEKVDAGALLEVPLQYARGFAIFKNSQETKMEVYDLANNESVIATYHLSTKDQSVKGSGRLHVPLDAVSVFSVSQAAYLLALDRGESIKGLQWASFALDDKLKNQVKTGATLDISGAETVDLEKLMMTQSKALFISPFDLSQKDKFASLGLPVVVVAEYQESSALARAEWIKFFGAFYGLEAEAKRYFDQVETQYLALKDQVDTQQMKPQVMIGSEYNGVWYVPGSDSFIAGLIHDAGGNYLFDQSPGVTNQMIDIEIILSKAEEIDFWGKIETKDILLEQLRSDHDKWKDLKAVRQGNVFYCNTQRSDYFGQAVVEPQVLLADLIHILNSDTSESETNHYFILAK